MSSPSTPKPNLEHVIVNFAKRYLIEFEAGRKKRTWVINNLSDKKRCYPQGIDNFRRWAGGTHEGRRFMEIIFPKDQP